MINRSLQILVISLFFQFGYGQNYRSKDSTEIFINSLNWDSFIIEPTYVPRLVLGQKAKRLALKNNPSVIKKLYCHILDEEKTVAIHLILSHMFETNNSKFAWRNIYEGASVSKITYMYNGCTWIYDLKERRFKINEQSILRVKEYWKNKLPRLTKIKL